MLFRLVLVATTITAALIAAALIAVAIALITGVAVITPPPTRWRGGAEGQCSSSLPLRQGEQRCYVDALLCYIVCWSIKDATLVIGQKPY